MAGRTRVLSRANGSPTARVLFVAEAPGRLGADRDGVPLSGDASGRVFERLLVEAGLARPDVFITNAVLCNPRDAAGLNRRPTASELTNCREHLAAVITLVDPSVVVALGRVALHALGRVCRHEIVLARDVAKPMRWNDRVLVPMYHPGPRSLARRPLAVQVEDYQALALAIAEHDKRDRESRSLSSACASTGSTRACG